SPFVECGGHAAALIAESPIVRSRTTTYLTSTRARPPAGHSRYRLRSLSRAPLQPAHNLHFAHAGGADGDVAFGGGLAVDHPDAAPAAALQPRAARHFEDVVLRLEDEARGEALALFHPLGPAPIRHRARRDLVADDLGRDGGDVPRLLLRAEGDGHRRPDLRVARVLLRDRQLQLQRGE